MAPTDLTPPHAKLHEGVWLPESETHFVQMMSPGAKRFQRDRFGRACYQKHKLDAAVAHCRARRRAVDIGAHVGLWAMHLEHLFDAVECFEPVPLFADILPANMRTDRYRLHRMALGREPGEIAIRVPLGQTGGSHVDTGEAHPAPKYDRKGNFRTFFGIPMAPLDDLGLTEVDFIKIDVEGYERPVIEGAEQTIRSCRPVIVAEQKGNDAAFGDPRNAAVSLLKQWGAVELQPPIAGDFILGWR